MQFIYLDTNFKCKSNSKKIQELINTSRGVILKKIML